MTYIKFLATVAAAAVLVTGCGSSDGGATGGDPAPRAERPSATVAAHNRADVAFAQAMIPHHRQAIAMSQLAAERARSAKVRALADEIEAAQGPEIDTMAGWLRAWGAPIPGDAGGMAGMGHDDHGMGGTPAATGGMQEMQEMQGMMSPGQMRRLRHASGAEFDRLFLTMMIEHHEGAVAMSRTELGDGRNVAAKRLARQIIATQEDEIATMRRYLTGA